MEKSVEFVLAYAALCKKYGLCIALDAIAEELYVVEYEKGWVESVALSEGVETFEAYQAQEG